jgi:hypothetical protein
VPRQRAWGDVACSVPNVIKVSFYSGAIGAQGADPVVFRNVVYAASWRDDCGVAYHVEFRIQPRVPLVSLQWSA